MNPLKTILVAVDFSMGSRAAVEQGARLARLAEAKLHILHVLDTEAVSSLADQRTESFEDQAKVFWEEAGAALVRWLAFTPLPANSQVEVVVGNPLQEILEHNKKLKADLLVAGIAGSGSSHAGAGSVAAMLARKAQSNVLLVRSTHARAFHKIVACIDFSEDSHDVATEAQRIALQDHGSVVFLHVWQDPWAAMPYAMAFADSGMMVSPPSAEQLEAYTRHLGRELHEFVGTATQGIQSQDVLYEAANYGNGIAEHAMAAKAELIVIGARGRTNLRYMLLGSTAERLVTKLPCSVLVVKPKAD